MSIPFVSSIAGKLFEAFTLPKLFRLAGRLDSPQFWQQSFAAAARLTPEFPQEIAFSLRHERSLLRFLLNTFKVEKPFPSTTDFAVTVAFELRASRVETSSAQIKKFATNLRREWCKSLNKQPSLKNYLKDVRDVHPSSLFENDADGDSKLDLIINDDKRLQAAYFESYSEKGGNDFVRVYLQNEHRYVPYSIENGLTVPVLLHSAQGADYGFFRVGYDYSLIRENRSYALQNCFKDETLGVETARFQHHEFGNTTGELLWMM